MVAAGMIAPAVSAQTLNFGIEVLNEPNTTEIPLTGNRVILPIPSEVINVSPGVSTSSLIEDGAAPLANELICIDRGPADTNFRLQTLDPNSQPIDLGVFGASFNIGTASLDVTFGNQTGCFVMPAAEDESNLADICDATSDPDLLFLDAFELGGDSSLAVDLRVTQEPKIGGGFAQEQIRYEIEVKNCSDSTTLTDVNVRDMFTADGSALAGGKLVFDSLDINGSPAVDWQAFDFVGAPPIVLGTPDAEGDEYVSDLGVSLAPDEGRLYVVSRSISPGSLSGEIIQVGAFAASLDAALPITSDAMSVNSTIGDNAAPTVSYVIDEMLLPAGVAARVGGGLELVEDGVGSGTGVFLGMLEGLDIVIEDTDSLLNRATLQVLSSDTSILTATLENPVNAGELWIYTGLPNGGERAELNPDAGLRLTTVTNANGPVLVNLPAEDAEGGLAGSDADLLVDVSPENDPPGFSISQGITNPTSNVINISGSGYCDALVGGCTSADHQFLAGTFFNVTISDYLIDVSAGIGESGALSQVVIEPAQLISGQVFVDGQFPTLTQSSSDPTRYDLTFQLSSASTVQVVAFEVKVVDVEGLETVIPVSFDLQ